MNYLQTQLPPQDKNIEQSFLVSILQDDKRFIDALLLKHKEFYVTQHQKIFKAMQSLYKNQERIDLVTLHGKLEKPDLDYLIKISSFAEYTNNIPKCVEIIQGHAVNRDLLTSICKIKEFVYTGNSNALDYAQTEIMKYKVVQSQGEIFNIKELIQDQIDQIEQHNTVKKNQGLFLGFKSLDKYINLQEGVYSVIAGRPSMGKTAFALTIIRNMALEGGKPGIISLEMGKSKLINRWLSMLTGINTMNFSRFNAIKPPEWQSLTDAAAEIYSKWDVLITDAPAHNINTVERQARQMVSKGADCLFIDQLSHIGGESDDDFKNYTQHSNRIARLKRELKIPIFLMAQLNRKVEDRANKEPKLSDLKMTGSLEEDADIVFLLFRPEYYEQDPQEKREKARDVVINIAKNRDGTTYREGDVIIFDKGRTLFEEDYNRLNQYY